MSRPAYQADDKRQTSIDLFLGRFRVSYRPFDQPDLFEEHLYRCKQVAKLLDDAELHVTWNLTDTVLDEYIVEQRRLNTYRLADILFVERVCSSLTLRYQTSMHSRLSYLQIRILVLTPSPPTVYASSFTNGTSKP